MKQTICALAGVMLLAAGISAQAPAAQGSAAPRPKLISPVRGQAEVLVTRPVSKRSGKSIITTMRVQNRAGAPIAGLTVDEFWYNKGGDPVTGGKFRYPKPLMPNEVIDVTIETPSVAEMDRNSYTFKHANGAIKTTNVAKIDMPKKTS
jgi:hypothetical protein